MNFRDFEADIPGSRVLRRKALVVVHDPRPDGALVRKCLIPADRAETFACGKATADLHRDLFRVSGGAAALAFCRCAHPAVTGSSNRYIHSYLTLASMDLNQRGARDASP